MTTCLTCAHWQPKKSGEMAGHGFAICAKGEPWKFMSAAKAACTKYESAPTDAAAARVAWMQKLDNNHLKKGKRL